ncbi:hypothetical protein EVA_03319 [gut metagenome]|uniref:Uncharacterized protein n=1 Tax=gut metagenome TaxID=749906 RepID=J9GZA7_9ZZZZ
MVPHCSAPPSVTYRRAATTARVSNRLTSLPNIWLKQKIWLKR